jgi:hypothetical protein
VKVGDWVRIFYSRANDTDICCYINIFKRPGGRVPPLPDGVEWPLAGRRKPLPGFPERQRIPYHERMNTYWDLVDKGIAYPEKFGKKRRFPEAPMPRQVVAPLKPS